LQVLRALVSFEIRGQTSAIVFDHQRSDTRNAIVQRRGFTAMMSGKDDQNDGLIFHPDHSGVIRDKRLAITSFVRDPHVLQISREAIVDLLLLHYAEQQVAGALRYQFSRSDHLQQGTNFTGGAVAKVNSGVVDSVAESLAHLRVGVFAKREVDRLVARRVAI